MIHCHRMCIVNASPTILLPSSFLTLSRCNRWNIILRPLMRVTCFSCRPKRTRQCWGMLLCSWIFITLFLRSLALWFSASALIPGPLLRFLGIKMLLRYRDWASTRLKRTNPSGNQTCWAVLLTPRLCTSVRADSFLLLTKHLVWYICGIVPIFSLWNSRNGKSATFYGRILFWIITH